MNELIYLCGTLFLFAAVNSGALTSVPFQSNSDFGMGSGSGWRYPMNFQYAAMESWRGTMTCHGLVASRSGTRRNGASFSFAGNRWSNDVPLRLPNTICVQHKSDLIRVRLCESVA